MGTELDLPPPPGDLVAHVERSLEQAPAAGSTFVLCGGNRGGLFMQLPRRLRNCRVVDASPSGELTIASPSRRPLSPDRVEAVTQFVGAGTGMANPLLALLAEAGGALAAHLLRRGARGPDGGDEGMSPLVAFREALVAVGDNPTLVLVDGVGSHDELWFTLTYLLGHDDQVRESALVVLAGLDAPPSLEEPRIGRWGKSVEHARKLVADGTASWWHLPALSAERVKAWLGPIQEPTVRHLLALSGGEDVAAARLWQRWRDSDFVRRVAGCWTVAHPDAEPVRGALAEIFQARLLPKRWPLAERVLTTAALFGDHFSGDVVAEVVSEGDDAVTPSEVIGLLDDLSPNDAGVPWVVDTVGSMMSVDPEGQEHHRRRYRFGSELQVVSLRGRVPEEEQRERRRRLYAAAVRLHRQDEGYGADLARLARESGQPDAEVAKWLAASATRTRLANLSIRAKLLLGISEPPRPDPFLAEELVETTWALFHAGTLDVAASLGDRAVAMAEVGGSAARLAQAHRATGLALCRAGRFRSAAVHLHAAFDHGWPLYRDDPTPANRRGLAITLHELGVLERDRGDQARAAQLLGQAEEHNRVLYRDDPTPANRRELAITLHELGVLERDRGDQARAAQLLGQAEEHNRVLYRDDPTPANRRELANTLNVLGRLERDRGDQARAAQLLNEAERLLNGKPKDRPDGEGNAPAPGPVRIPPTERNRRNVGPGQPRQRCPCGSGHWYYLCHGRASD